MKGIEPPVLPPDERETPDPPSGEFDDDPNTDASRPRPAIARQDMATPDIATPAPVADKAISRIRHSHPAGPPVRPSVTEEDAGDPPSNRSLFLITTPPPVPPAIPASAPPVLPGAMEVEGPTLVSVETDTHDGLLPVPNAVPPTVASRLDDALGPAQPKTEDVQMPTPPPAPPSPPPKKGGWGKTLIIAAIGLAALIPIGLGYWNPTEPDRLDEIATAEPRLEEPTPEPEAVIDEPQRAVVKIDPNPTTGYEDDEPPAEPPVADPPKAVAIAEKVPSVETKPTPAPVAAKATAPPKADPPPVAAPKPVAAPPPAALPVPESAIVSSMGKKPACKGDFTWGNVDPGDGYPRKIDGAYLIVDADGTVYRAANTEKIGAGPSRFCVHATGLTPG